MSSNSHRPKYYENRRRPPLKKALVAEGRRGKSIDEAYEALERKGYFTPKPRPWKLSPHDRGQDDYAILDKFGDLVATITSKEDAEFIIKVVNAHKS